jgi:hypothetical protein
MVDGIVVNMCIVALFQAPVVDLGNMAMNLMY